MGDGADGPSVGPLDLTELTAREAIRDLVATYTWAGDRGRSADLASLFASGGVLDVGDHGGRWQGRPEIERQLDAVSARVAAAGEVPGPVHHHVSSLHIRVAADARGAEATAYFVVYTRIGIDHWGRYRDRFEVDADGAWVFAERVVRVDGHSPGSLVVVESE